MNILIIDTSDNKRTVVSLKINGKIDTLERESTVWKSQAVLPLVMELLKKHSLMMQDLDSIEVEIGPGSFTGLRVGVAIANALGTQLRIPINGKPVGEIVEPVYQ